MLSYIYIYLLGILSILSVCTVIVIPVLVSQIISRARKIYTAVVFSLGFTLTFSAIGAITGFIGEIIVAKYLPPLLLFGSIVTFIMALRFFRIIEFNIPSLNKQIYSGANVFLLGMVFGIVALSCIGPLLSVVFIFAIAQKSIVLSIIIFSIYSLGYATPLIAAGTIIEEKKIVQFVKNYRSRIDFISGILLLFSSAYLILLYFGIPLFV